MPSYVITGVSRGLGYEFLRQLSSEPSNTVVGLVRDVPATLKTIAADAEFNGRTNIHILQGDITDYPSLKKAAEETTKILDGKLDYLIANAAIISTFSAYEPLGTLGINDPAGLEAEFLELFKVNVIGNVHLFSLFIPLILKGTVKKVITLGTGMADVELTAKYALDLDSTYSITKAAMNMTIAKFSAQYSEEGVLFMAVAPGLVDTGAFAAATPEQMGNRYKMYGKFAAYAPHFKGPTTAEEAIKLMLDVIENATVEKDAGTNVSQFGTRQWL